MYPSYYHHIVHSKLEDPIFIRHLPEGGNLRRGISTTWTRYKHNIMLMPKENRKAIYEYLLEKGVIVAKKDFTCKHPHVKETPNLHVIKALQSMKSRGYVKEQFAWRHYYWYLTNEGIQYLRDYLHLPSQTLPETLRKVDPVKKTGGRSFGAGEGGERPAYGDRPRDGGYGQRPTYRAAEGGFGSRGAYSRPTGFGRGFNAV